MILIFYLLFMQTNPNIHYSLFNIRSCNHQKCKDNCLCSDINSTLEHSINLTKRTIILNIYHQYSLQNFNFSIKKCYNPIDCNNPKCIFDHYVAYKHRLNIIYIINSPDNDIQLIDFHTKNYTDIKDIGKIKEIKEIKDIKEIEEIKEIEDIKEIEEIKEIEGIEGIEGIEDNKDIEGIEGIEGKKSYSTIIKGKSYLDTVKVNIDSIDDNYSFTDNIDKIVIKQRELKENISNAKDIKSKIKKFTIILNKYEDKIEKNKKQLLHIKDIIINI